MEQGVPVVGAALRDLFFGYDKALPFNAEERDLGVRDGVHTLHFAIDSTHGERVPGLLWTPESADGPLPLVILQHGATSKKEDPYISATAWRWAREGFVVAAIDAARHGERQSETFDLSALWRFPWLRRDHAIQMCVDLQRTLDYLATRPEPDVNRAGYVGFSMGTINGVAFVARVPRVRAAVFFVGGARLDESWPIDDEGRMREQRLVSEIVDPAHFAPLIAPRPVLQINGLKDEICPPVSAQALFDALGEPKQMLWYDGGHTDLGGGLFKAAEAFLRERL